MKGIKYAGGTMERLPTGVYRISTVQDGKQVQRRFKTKQDAQRFLESVRDGRKALTVAQIADAQAAYNALERASVGKSLYEIINEWLGSARTVVRTLPEVVREYLEDIDGSVGELTYERYRNLLIGFSKEVQVDVHRITTEICKEYLNRHCRKPETFTSYRTTLGTFFKWALKRKYLMENPIELVRRPRLKERVIGYYTVEETRLILQYAIVHDPAIVPYLVLGFFAGLRPIERNRMTIGINAVTDPKNPDGRWFALNITGDVAKGNGFARRYVELSQQCRKFLLYWESEFGMLVDKVTPGNFETSARREKEVITKAIGRYVKDGDRHTFATHHFAAYGDSARTASYCGHTEGVALAHYRGRIGTTEGRAYLGISPEECGLRDFTDDTIADLSERRAFNEHFLAQVETGDPWTGVSKEHVEVRVRDYLDSL